MYWASMAANFRPDSEMAVNIASRFWLQADPVDLCRLGIVKPLPKYAAIAFAIVVPSAQLIYHFRKFDTVDAVDQPIRPHHS